MLASCENAEEAHIQGRSSVRLGEFYLKISWSHLLTFSHTSLMGNRAMQGSGSEFGGSLCFGNGSGHKSCISHLGFWWAHWDRVCYLQGSQVCGSCNDWDPMKSTIWRVSSLVFRAYLLLSASLCYLCHLIPRMGPKVASACLDRAFSRILTTLHPQPIHLQQLDTEFLSEMPQGKYMCCVLISWLCPLKSDPRPSLGFLLNPSPPNQDQTQAWGPRSPAALLGCHPTPTGSVPSRRQVQPVFVTLRVTGIERLLEASMPLSLKGREHCSLSSCQGPAQPSDTKGEDAMANRVPTPGRGGVHGDEKQRLYLEPRRGFGVWTE